jgi:hypothetical protein
MSARTERAIRDNMFLVSDLLRPGLQRLLLPPLDLPLRLDLELRPRTQSTRQLLLPLDPPTRFTLPPHPSHLNQLETEPTSPPVPDLPLLPVVVPSNKKQGDKVILNSLQLEMETEMEMVV